MIYGLNIYYTSKILKERRVEGLKPVSTNKRQRASGLKPVSTKGQGCKKIRGSGLRILQ